MTQPSKSTRYLRDYAMYAVIFGIFGFSWFGWAQESPPESWRIFLGIASSLSFVVACVGGVIALKHRDKASALGTDKKNYLRFRNIVIPEVLLSFIGGVLLMFTNKTEYVAPYISFIVGVHFLPLVSLFRDRGLFILALLVIFSSVISVFISDQLQLTPTTIAATASGASLFLFALRGLYNVYIYRKKY